MRFSLQRLFASLTLIVLGTALAVYAVKFIPFAIHAPLEIAMWIGSGALIGSGSFLPFKYGVRGTALGASFQIFSLAILSRMH